MDWQRDLPYDHIAADLPLSGVPTEADIQQLLRDTEEKLKLNASSIEQSLRDLQGKMGEHWGGERPSSPTELLQWFHPRHPNGLRPVATGHQELLEFYRALQQFLKAEEHGEEVVLQLLVNVSYQCGVSFPSSASPGPQHPSLLPSVFCTVRDEPPLELQDLWEDVRLQLQRHLLEKLEMVGGGSGGSGGNAAERAREEAAPLPLPGGPGVGALPASPRQGRAGAPPGLPGVRRGPGGRAGLRAAGGGLPGGFRAAVPALAAMVTEDLHALNAVGAEPHATLGFLNQAYLGTVAKEMGALMEREIENALKDNTAPQWKGARRLSRSKATVVPQEPVRKVRSFSLTSHQLGCLSRLAWALLELEQRVEELATDVGFLSCAGEAACGPRGIQKRSKEDLEAGPGPGEGSSAATPDLLLNSAEPVSLEFEWRGAFAELVPQMAHCVKVLLEDVCARGLQQEEVARASSAVLALGTVPQRQGIGLTCLERECPKMIAKARGLPPGESPGAAGPDTAAGGCNVCVLTGHWDRYDQPTTTHASLGTRNKGVP
ncbi:uncharacterized protein LOC134060535 [Sardina pilchardus]|uniref:uncharacterized protein LOC134060535 n=1 Tax=Sardina pilchardus TaxID=27697 RepID=UPI002E0D533B